MKKKMNISFRIGFVITSLMVLMVLTGLIYTPYDPSEMNTSLKYAGISFEHIMGCDNLGRDIFSRVMQGSATTLLVAVSTVLIGAVVGTVIGAFTGYYGGIVDSIFMRINDTIFAFPSILLALVFIGIFGQGTLNVIWALGIAFIPSFVRLIRAEVITLKEMDFVKSARLMGAGDLRLIFVHILPSTLKTLLSSVLIGFNNAVLAEAGMSFLGIGVQPPNASLGRMLSEAQSHMFVAPWYALFPGIVIILMILGFTLMGEGLDAS